MKGNIVRQLNWVIFNGLMMALMWFGLVQSIEGAQNILIVWCWVGTVLTLFTLHPEFLTMLSERGRTMPRPVSATVDLIIICGLLWHGWIVTGIAMIFQHLTSEGAFAKAEKIAIATAVNKDRPPDPGGHHFINGVCPCGHKTTDDPERCWMFHKQKEQPCQHDN